MLNLTADQLLNQLGLEPHPLESGYFRRTYESRQTMELVQGQERFLGTSIYYCLTTDSPINFFHRNRSDILHFYHLGGVLEYTTLTDQGALNVCRLGNDVMQGEMLQLLVPGHVWKAARLVQGDFALISEVVIPGFEYKDNEIASFDVIRSLVADDVYGRLKPLIKAMA